MAHRKLPDFSIGATLRNLETDLGQYDGLFHNYGIAFYQLETTGDFDSTLMMIRERREQLAGELIKKYIAAHMAVKIDEVVSALYEPSALRSTRANPVPESKPEPTPHASAAPKPRRRRKQHPETETESRTGDGGAS